jgi:hypothetical protein
VPVRREIMIADRRKPSRGAEGLRQFALGVKYAVPSTQYSVPGKTLPG